MALNNDQISMESTKNDVIFLFNTYISNNKPPFPLGCPTIQQKTPFFWILIFNAAKNDLILMSVGVASNCYEIIVFNTKIV